jgi:tRNA modification GTPase
MPPLLDDTIVALSSAAGPGLRGIVRLSGPDSVPLAGSVFRPSEPFDPTRRAVVAGTVVLPGLAADLPTDLYVWPPPRTYTGQPLVELHTVSSPPLLELLIAELLNAGARAAGPGEFTLRAFLAGRCDLPRAEAVLGVIEAADRAELTHALAQLAGGVSRPLDGLRDDLLNLLADVEAGLDFSDEDITFTDRPDLLLRLGKGLAQLTNLRKQLEGRAVGGPAFRAALVGHPNAGKSSLFNALTGGPAALVSPQPGTTRDYLLKRIDLGGVAVELADTAGWQDTVGAVEEQAQSLGRGQARAADLVLVCVQAGRPPDATEREWLARPGAVGVATKCDLAAPAPGLVPTSAATGAGLGELRAILSERARSQRQPALAPSLSRCRHHVDAGLDHLRKAHHAVLFDDPPEVVALDLRGALEEIGALVGAVYTDDLLDRIFSRFCIGK